MTVYVSNCRTCGTIYDATEENSRPGKVQDMDVAPEKYKPVNEAIKS